MEVTKYRNNVINGDELSTLNWIKASDKNELLVEVFTSDNLFEKLSNYWKDLEKRSDSTLYMSFEWVYNWWKNFGNTKQRSLYLITIWDGTKLVALAPFYKGYSKFGSVILERRLQLIGSGGSPNEQFGYMYDNGVSDALDVIVDRSYTHVVADRLLDILNPEFLKVDVVTFNKVGDNSFIVKCLYPKMQQLVYETEVQQTDLCHYIDLSFQTSIEDFVSDQNPEVQLQLRRKISAIDSEMKRYEIKELKTQGEIEKATDEIIALSQQRGGRSKFATQFSDGRFVQFFKDTLKDSYKNYQLIILQAPNKEDNHALQVILSYKGRFYKFVTCFNEKNRFSKSHREIGMLVAIVKEAIENRVSRIEFSGNGQEDKPGFPFKSFNTWKLTLSFRKDRSGIFLYLNRIMSFLYKYIKR